MPMSAPLEDVTATKAPTTSGWLRSQLTAPNIVGLVMLIVSMVSWHRSHEARNEMQDYRIKTLEDRVAQGESLYVRSDLYDLRFSNIEAKLEALDKKLDVVRHAVR